jgi:glycosyltransferase involved in cell wall biosynthesis
MRICMICSQFHPTVGGTESQALGLARKLVRAGAGVSVLTRAVTGLPPREDVDGVTILRSIRAPDRCRLFAMAYMLSVLLFLWKMRKRYDIIHCHILYFHALPAVLIGRLFRKKVLIKIACSGEFGDVAAMRRMRGGGILLRVCRGADRFIAVSEEACRELRGIGISEGRISIVPNFVDAEAFRPAVSGERQQARGRLGVPPDVKLVTSVGRLTPQKGLDRLIEAWQAVAARRPSSRFLVVGDGPLADNLAARARALPAGDTIMFTGARADVAELLRASDLFVLQSLAEGLPNALLEAMACGLPCVASRIGGNVDLIEDGANGLLADPLKNEEIAGAILRLMADEELARRMGAAARETVERCYARERIIPRYLKLYAELM